MKGLIVVSLLGAVVLPAAEYSTYLNSANPLGISRLTTDPAGNAYLAGSRAFPNINGLSDAILMKLDATGAVALFAYLSGKGNDVANAVAVDPAGNLYMAGTTTSPDFPVHNALFPSQPANPRYVGFIAKFSPDASQLLYSTYFPGAVTGLATDSGGNLYATGTTTSPTFPVTPGLPAAKVAGGVPIVYGAFLTKIAPAGDRIVYSMVVSGYSKDCGCCSSCFTSDRGATGVAVAVDGAGNAYIAGNSNVSDLPATAGAMVAGGVGAFVAKVNAAGTALTYLTYLGSGHQTLSPYLNVGTLATGLAADAGGNAYVVGSTWDPQLPVTAGAYQPVFDGWTQIDNYAITPPTDAYVVKLNPGGTAAVWGTYLGGSGADAASGAALDAAGNLWVTGTTQSSEFPNAQGWSAGGDFLVEFNSAGSALPFAARYPEGTVSQTFAIDGSGLVHVASQNGLVSAVAATPRPAVRPWAITNAAGGVLGGQVAAGEVVAIYGPHIGAFPPVQAGSASGTLPTVLGASQVLFDGRPAPLLYSSDGQINAVVPFDVQGQPSTLIRIVNQGVAGPAFQAMVVGASPQIFQDGTGYAAALNQDGSVNSAANPAKVGSVVSIWATGVAPPYPPLADGQIATAAQDYGCCQVYANLVGSPMYPIEPTYLQVLYAGVAPGLVAGIVQINFVAPASGEAVLASAGGFSQQVGIHVAP